ncbi:MAG: glycosyltransferase family 4 protein [Acidobacteriota bacterium]
MSSERLDVSKSVRPINVLYCESNTDGTVGGSHYCLLYLVKHLDRSRFTPTVLFYDNHAIVAKFRAIAATLVHDKDSPALWGSGSGVLALPGALARRAVNLAKLGRQVAGHVALLRARKIDLVHLNNSITRHHDWMVAALVAGVPCVVHERGLPRYGAIDRFFGKKVDLVIPMSRWIGRAMVEQGVSADNIRVIYDGLDPAAFTVTQSSEALRQAWSVGPDQPVVGIVGNIRHWKGQETVVRALIEVVKVHPDVVCFFVGAATAEDQPYMDGIETLIAQAGIGKNVRFTGYQANVPSLVGMMRFLIHASVEPEPFGMVVLEAMAMRKAVVGSRAGGVVEMVLEGETGYTFPPGDAVTLAGHMLDLLGDPAKAERMGALGQQRLISEFSVHKYMSVLHAAYDAVLAKKALPAGVDMAAGVMRDGNR